MIFLNLRGLGEFFDLKVGFKIEIGFGCLFLLLFEFWLVLFILCRMFGIVVCVFEGFSFLFVF